MTDRAAVFGEARPWIAGVIVPVPGTETEGVAAAVARVNSGLPDYARVGHWITALEPFTPGSGLGLSIVHRIADLHGAEIELGEGSGGRGVRVTVLFPDNGPV